MCKFAPIAFAFAALCAAAPALADDRPVGDLVLIVLGGMENGSAMTGPSKDVVYAVKKTGDGMVEATSSNGPKITFAVTEAEKCVFDLAFDMEGSESGKVRFDANLVEEIKYTVSTPGMPNMYRVELITAAPEKVVQNVLPDGAMRSSKNSSTFASTMTAEGLNAAAAAFRTHCPGVAS